MLLGSYCPFHQSDDTIDDLVNGIWSKSETHQVGGKQDNVSRLEYRLRRERCPRLSEGTGLDQECQHGLADGNIGTPSSEEYFRTLSLGKQLRDSLKVDYAAGASVKAGEVHLLLR